MPGLEVRVTERRPEEVSLAVKLATIRTNANSQGLHGSLVYNIHFLQFILIIATVQKETSVLFLAVQYLGPSPAEATHPLRSLSQDLLSLLRLKRSGLPCLHRAD